MSQSVERARGGGDAPHARPPNSYARISLDVGDILRSAMRLDMTHVPYQGSGPDMLAITAGQVEVMMMPVAVAYPQRWRLGLLGVTMTKRFAVVPDVPTLKEQGVNAAADARFLAAENERWGRAVRTGNIRVES